KTVADLNRNGLQSAPVESRNTTQNAGIGLQNEQLPLAIQHRLSWKKNIRSNDSVDFLLVNQSRCAGRVAQIDGNHRFVDYTPPSEPQLARDGHIIECAVDLNARRQVRLGGDWFEAKIIATIYGDCAHRRTTINRQPRFSAVDKSAHH